MSGFDDEPLSLESLFAFVSGSSARADDAGGDVSEDAAEEGAAEQPSDAPQTEKGTGASVDEEGNPRILEMIVKAPTVFGLPAIQAATASESALLGALAKVQSDPGEVRAIIDERLEQLIQQRLDEVRSAVASAPGDGGAEGARATPPQLQVDARLASAGDSERTESAKAAEDAVPEPAKAAGAALRQEKVARPAGRSGEKSERKASSALFDEPPTSIKDGMREAEELHRRGFARKACLIVASGTLAAGLLAFAAFQLPRMSEGEGDAGEGSPAAEAVFEPSIQSDAEPGKQPKPAEGKDLSGSVTYRYVTTGADGDERPTTETVSFGGDGLCETSTLEVQLADDAAVEAFLQGLERDFGSSCKESEAQGANARAVIDVSANKLDREGYEDALRVSVEELTIVKKS
ncbi:MAG: hypothetical protein ACLR9M_04790 [Eggerthella lenta]